MAQAQYFDADRPIERRDEDRLGRRAFADAIARQALAAHAEHGFTIGIVGAWGSGKTSVLNMVADAIGASGVNAQVLRFNPWLFASASDLIQRFFGELSAQLGKSKVKRLKHVARAFSRVGRALAPLAPIPGTSSIANAAGHLVDYWANPPSLDSERDALRKALAEADSRIVVLVDDIDRLEPAETREVMRLVRLTSDLPNVVFLLSFDRSRVARSLSSNEWEGQEYLDKIVQVTYELPVVRETILPTLLFGWLDEAIKGRELLPLDAAVWRRVFYEIVKPLVSNLRDVKRYLYSLPVTLDMVGSEIALADLLGMEAIRVLRPALFQAIRGCGYLVHPDSESGQWVPEEQRAKDAKEALLRMIENQRVDSSIVAAAFEILFPATQGPLGRGTYGATWDRTWRKDRRVASAEVLRIYLQGGLDESAIAAREVEDLVEALTDRQKLEEILDSYDGKRFEEALERLEDFEYDYPVEAVQTAVPVLANRMGSLSRHSRGFLDMSPRFKASRVIYRLLRRITDRGQLAELVREMLPEINTLSGRLEVIELVGHRENVGHRLVGEDDASALERTLIDQLLGASGESLAAEWDLAVLSFRPVQWVGSEDKEQLIARFRTHLDDDGFVLSLIRTAVGYARFDGNAEKRLPWDGLIDVFGDGLSVAVNRVAASQLAEEVDDDLKEAITLSQRYASGWRPNDFGPSG